MKLLTEIVYGSPCYNTGRKITVKGLMIHSVGCNQPNPRVFANSWKTNDEVCCHGVLGADGTVIQTLPWNHRAWHCYKGPNGSGNNTHIGIEMTEPATIKYTGGASFVDLNPTETKKHVLGTYKTAVELFAYLCKKFNLDPLKDGVVISHNEGYKRGIASGHADVEHIWNKYGLTMNQFRKDIKNAMTTGTTDIPTTKPSPSKTLYRVRKSWTNAKSQIGAYESIDNAINACKDGYSVFDDNGKVIYSKGAEPTTDRYKVRVTIDDLNIRKGPGVSYDISGQTGKGVFTIVETKDNWGKLRSGRGWICLDYAEKI